jgi:outer membrane protein assembly factor BamA
VPSPDKAGLSFYPLPAFAADKDAGLSAGILAGLVFTDDRGIQNALLSLSAGYQHLVRWNTEAEYRYSPDDWSLLDLDGYIAQRVENSLRLFYEDVNALDGRYHVRLESFDFRSATDRFFGVGDNTPLSAQSVRTSNEYRAEARFGPRLNDEWDVEGTARWRKFRIGDSLITDHPQTTDLYPQQPGVEGGSVIAGGIRIVHDSRDNPITPTSGLFGNAYFERAEFFSPTTSHPYWLTGASTVAIVPLDGEKQFVTAVNLAAQVATGNHVPFWELPSLGGPTTLRSYNGARFQNKGMILFNVEERIRVLRTSLFDVRGEVQVAPFVDVGKVYDSLDDVLGRGIFQNFHYSAGIGFRGVVPPSFVGRLDVALGGGEGVGVTVGLDYPF